MGAVDCDMNQQLACCCALRPNDDPTATKTKSKKRRNKTKQIDTKKPPTQSCFVNATSDESAPPFRLKKPPMKQLKKALSREHSQSVDSTTTGCKSCVKSRRYLDYLAKTLDSLRQMNLGSCALGAECAAPCLNPTMMCPHGAVSKKQQAKRRKKLRKRYPVLAPPRYVSRNFQLSLSTRP